MKRKVALLLLAVFMGTGAIEPSLVSFGAEKQEEEEFSAKRMKPEEGPDDLVLSEELNQTERLGQGEDLEQTETDRKSVV